MTPRNPLALGHVLGWGRGSSACQHGAPLVAELSQLFEVGGAKQRVESVPHPALKVPRPDARPGVTSSALVVSAIHVFA